jgi:hypothetical protein
MVYLMSSAENQLAHVGIAGRILGTYRFNATHLVTLVEPQVAEFPALYAVVWNKSCLKTLLASVMEEMQTSPESVLRKSKIAARCSRLVSPTCWPPSPPATRPQERRRNTPARRLM